MTTLYAGVLTNKTQVARRQQDPHFEILFRISYGMSKTQLAELNNALGRPPYQTRKYGVAECQVCLASASRHELTVFQGLSYRFTMRAGMPNPCAMFTQPLNGEIVGAGFQKIPLSKVSRVLGRNGGADQICSTTSCGGRDCRSCIVQQSAHGSMVRLMWS